MRILTLCLALIACSPMFSQDQLVTGKPPGVRVVARNSQMDGAILHLSGNVDFRTDGFVLQADEVTYHRDTGEIEAHGNVRVKTEMGEVTGNDVRWKPASPSRFTLGQTF